MRRRTRIFVTFAGVLATGCASYTQSKIDLVNQARHGVALVREANASRQASIDATFAQQRKQLDAAFDADVVTNAASLTSDWVTAHRKAYAIGVDAIDAQRHDAETAQSVTATNLDAIDAALVQLQQMHSTELQFTLPEIKR